MVSVFTASGSGYLIVLAADYHSVYRSLDRGVLYAFPYGQLKFSFPAVSGLAPP